MRRRTKPLARRGATMVESVIVLGVLLTLVFGMLDLGVALFRHHQLSYAARGACRGASVHGSEAAGLGPWGPGAVGPVAASTAGPVPAETRAHLCSLNPADVTVAVEWPDGDNEPGSRVRVTLETSYQPVIAWLYGSDPIPFKVVSTLPISH